VVVSTPQDVALNVAQKAIAMFNQLNCPILGMVENMSYYTCAHCGERDDIFGSGGTRKVADRLQAPYLGEIPLATAIRVQSDEGKPIVLSDPESPQAEAFQSVAENMAAQISIRNMSGQVEQEIQISF
jgi:ATP-binding protein involved in chromosome partitioning